MATHSSGRLTFKNISSPLKSRKKGSSQATPSKRAKFHELFLKENTSEPLKRSLQEVKQAYKQCKNSEHHVSDELLIPSLVCSYGLDITCRLLGAISHVPKGFADRKTYIGNIVNVDSCHISQVEIDILIPGLEKVAARSPFKLNNDILWACCHHYQEGYLCFMVPPVSECQNCKEALYSLNKVQITIFTLEGPKAGMKTTMRCKKGCGAIHNIDRFSVPGVGSKFYATLQPVICSSNLAYMTRDVHELLCESANHAFVSHHAFTEVYNSLFESGVNTIQYKKWVQSGHLYNSDIKDTEEPEDKVYELNDDGSQELQTERRHQPYMLTRKKSINGYFNGELSNEVHERQDDTLTIRPGETKEDLMERIDVLRREELYPHNFCSQSCKDKGCESLRVIDCCWKVCMPHCMYAVEMEVAGLPLLNFPNVCTKEPKPQSVFCEDHHKFLQDNNIPTRKAEFLRYIGCSEKPFSTADVEKVDRNTVELSRQLKHKEHSPPSSDYAAATYQGTSEIISKIEPSKWEELDASQRCNKDTGLKSRLRQRSRGHFISVTGGGHIQYIEPIFKSESPSQIFLIILRVMILEFSKMDEDEQEKAIEKYVLSYDNMCQLDSLRAAKEDLPFPAPFDKIWNRIQKIIDRLHMKNHVNPLCKDIYNPSQIPAGHNTMIAEQTFAWFSRFKKNVNSMSQRHHMFFIHRNIKRRNIYSERCRSDGRTPLLPGINLNTHG